MLERCQLEPLRPDQRQRQQPGTGTGSRPPPPTICTGMHPAQQIAPPAQTEGQSSSAQRAAALAFFFCRAFTRLPPARPAGSAARHALGVVPPREKAGKCPGSAGHSAWILRPPPAPGRISTASAAPDDPASSRPPPTMTTHQRQPCPTCTAPTACQPCQTSQQQRSRQRRHRGGQARQRRTPAAACIAAACRMIHPAAPRKTAILRRRRRGQILHLTG